MARQPRVAPKKHGFNHSSRRQDWHLLWNWSAPNKFLVAKTKKNDFKNVKLSLANLGFQRFFCLLKIPNGQMPHPNIWLIQSQHFSSSWFYGFTHVKRSAIFENPILLEALRRQSQEGPTWVREKHAWHEVRGWKALASWPRKVPVLGLFTNGFFSAMCGQIPAKHLQNRKRERESLVHPFWDGIRWYKNWQHVFFIKATNQCCIASTTWRVAAPRKTQEQLTQVLEKLQCLVKVHVPELSIELHGNVHPIEIFFSQDVYLFIKYKSISKITS